jgi:hypothetical protein
MRKKFDIYNIIGRASVDVETITQAERDYVVDVLRQRTDVPATNQLRAELQRLFPTEYETAVLTWWNIKIPVVELIQARTAEEATNILIKRLSDSGFATEYAEDNITDIRDGALVHGGMEILDRMFDDASQRRN